MHRPAPCRRGFLLATAGAGAALGLGLASAGPAGAGTPTHPRPHPFGRYGSPAARRTPKTLYADPLTVPENRPRFTRAEAAAHTREAYLGDWRPYERRP
ncbi:hypothetical protein [Streptomyces violaceorubidus]|uniref:hypothetical protein n=1 Tax=Streptomyces violaceorubidus TaxID=284042 RepID=UPI0004BEC884